MKSNRAFFYEYLIKFKTGDIPEFDKVAHKKKYCKSFFEAKIFLTLKNNGNNEMV